jgi:hypothetical protein
MINRLAVVSALVLGSAFGAQVALAQAASAPSRADVKSQIPADRTHDQNITGERMPTSDQLPPKQKKQKAKKAAPAASQPAK